MVEVRADVAVVILTYNESLHLPRALEHIRGFAREVFVIDSYSTDNTVAIAEAFGAHVLQNPFQHQAQQFRWAMDHMAIHSGWVMRLDADEIVEPDLSAEIIERLSKLPSDVMGVYLRRKTIFQGKFIRYGGRYPLKLLRIWRQGKAQIEDRSMDEHIYLTEGRAVTFSGGFADHSLIDLSAFIDKHNKYASREASDVLNQRLKLSSNNQVTAAQLGAFQTKVKRFIKEKIYNHIPFELSSLGYFIYRYLIRGGFLDGRRGLTYHVLQGFWYRFLVGAKVKELERISKISQTERGELEADRVVHLGVGEEQRICKSRPGHESFHSSE